MLKFEEPHVVMVDNLNFIIPRNIPINALFIANDSLVKLTGIFENKIASNFLDIDRKIEIEKPLSEKERETLLVIIAVLAKEARIDINKTSKAGELIASLTQQLGSSVGPTTIETHLKKIPDALKNRAK